MTIGNKKEKRIYSLALSITALMRNHPDRLEAIDAYDMARILFRKESSSHLVPRRPQRGRTLAV
jgi:hypothetical protein